MEILACTVLTWYCMQLLTEMYKCSVDTTHYEDRQLEHIAYSQLAVAVYTFFVTVVVNYDGNLAPSA